MDLASKTCVNLDGRIERLYGGIKNQIYSILVYKFVFWKNLNVKIQTSKYFAFKNEQPTNESINPSN